MVVQRRQGTQKSACRQRKTTQSRQEAAGQAARSSASPDHAPHQPHQDQDQWHKNQKTHRGKEEMGKVKTGRAEAVVRRRLYAGRVAKQGQKVAHQTGQKRQTGAEQKQQGCRSASGLTPGCRKPA